MSRLIVQAPPEKLARLRELQAARAARAAEAPSLYRAAARANQLPPDGDWSVWLVMAGRGFGKTWLGAGWLLEQAVRQPGDYAVVAPTFTDTRKVCVEGESGLLAHIPDALLAGYNQSKWQIDLTNGSKIHMLSADVPDRIRGYNLAGAWCDEIGAWRRDRAWYEALLPALRKHERPRICATTTPRSTRLMRDLATRGDGTVVVTSGSTWDNAANLSPAALEEMRRWEGTTRGRQELHGELLEDMPGASFKRAWIDAGRVTTPPVDPWRVVVAVDPTGSNHEGSDEAGIVTVAVGRDQHFYILADDSRVASPDAWARAAVAAFDTHRADRVVAERNFGGDMVEATLRHVRGDLPITMVTASRGKTVRAEPVAALYEQGKVHHVGSFTDLEDQMTTWEPSSPDSPDRLDALVWAVTELAGGFSARAFLDTVAPPCRVCGVPVARSRTHCRNGHPSAA